MRRSFGIIRRNMKNVKVKLQVRKDGVSGLRYKIASLNGALTIPDGNESKSPGEWIGESAASRLIGSSRYDVTVVPEND